MNIVQPGIFDIPLVTYNKAVRKLCALDASGARELFSQYSELVSHAELELENALCALFDDWTFREALESDPETVLYLYEQWFRDREVARIIDSDSSRRKLLGSVSKSIFTKSVENLFTASIDDDFFINGGAVRSLILAEKWKRADELCKRVMTRTLCPGKILGYRAFSLYMLGMPVTARMFWLQASLVDPYDIDMDYVPDPLARELFFSPEYICDELDLSDGPWRRDRGWSGALGLAAAVFKPVTRSELCSTVNLEALWEGRKSHERQGQAFAAGLLMIFGDNFISANRAHNTGIITAGSDTFEMRRELRGLAPELYSKAISVLSSF